MATPIEVLIPDIGGFKDVSVVDVLVKDGQQIEKETPLVTIKTEKAAMDVPAPPAGEIPQATRNAGDKVSEGSLILLLEPAADAAPAPKAAAAPAPGEVKASATPAPAAGKPSAPSTAPSPAPSTAARPAPAPREARPAAAVDEQAFSKAHASP